MVVVIVVAADGTGFEPTSDAKRGKILHATPCVTVRGFEHHREVLKRLRHQHAVAYEKRSVSSTGWGRAGSGGGSSTSPTLTKKSVSASCIMLFSRKVDE